MRAVGKNRLCRQPVSLVPCTCRLVGWDQYGIGQIPCGGGRAPTAQPGKATAHLQKVFLHQSFDVFIDVKTNNMCWFLLISET